MQFWFHSILILVIIGFSKAQHFIQLVVLGALGLAGLWLLHTLANDINKFVKPSGILATKPKFFYAKRSLENQSFNKTVRDYEDFNVDIDWERILANDPVGCARSFICQLAAKNNERTLTNESVMLHIIQSANHQNTGNTQLRDALNYGKKTRCASECRKVYNYCPFSIETMIHIIKYLKKM
ncbi:hypothetical protein FQA39_LY07017 [Lamprigera yunnana]|nr:hypothetical protein FQA39_LY07017 [Lamprigera yunnana]